MEFGCHKKFHLKFFLCGGRLYRKKSNMPGKYMNMTREERSRKQKLNTLLIYCKKKVMFLRAKNTKVIKNAKISTSYKNTVVLSNK